MKKKCLWNKMFAITLASALLLVFTGCGSTKKAELPVVTVPDIDYSRLGPYDSVILAYIDPQLVKVVDPKDTSHISSMLTFTVIVDAKITSTPMVNRQYPQNSAQVQFGLTQSCQIQIPNGSHTFHVVAGSSGGGGRDILPFEVALEDVAITYKIRAATDEEKRAGGLGVGNTVYTMEEVAQRKLR